MVENALPHIWGFIPRDVVVVKRPACQLGAAFPIHLFLCKAAFSEQESILEIRSVGTRLAKEMFIRAGITIFPSFSDSQEKGATTSISTTP